MYTPIDLLPGARTDLADLRIADPDAVAAIIAFLQEAKADAELLDKFTTHGDVKIGSFKANVKGWVVAKSGANNLFRFRVLDTPATRYRVIYGYDWRTRRIGILGISHKDHFDYDITTDFGRRIVADWRDATGEQDT